MFQPAPTPKRKRPPLALDHEADTGSEQDSLGHRGRRRERHEGIHHVVVHLGKLVAARPRCFAVDGDMRMLGDPERLEAAEL